MIHVCQRVNLTRKRGKFFKFFQLLILHCKSNMVPAMVPRATILRVNTMFAGIVSKAGIFTSDRDLLKKYQPLPPPYCSFHKCTSGIKVIIICIKTLKPMPLTVYRCGLTPQYSLLYKIQKYLKMIPPKLYKSLHNVQNSLKLLTSL